MVGAQRSDALVPLTEFSLSVSSKNVSSERNCTTGELVSVVAFIHQVPG